MRRCPLAHAAELDLDAGARPFEEAARGEIAIRSRVLRVTALLWPPPPVCSVKSSNGPPDRAAGIRTSVTLSIGLRRFFFASASSRASAESQNSSRNERNGREPLDAESRGSAHPSLFISTSPRLPAHGGWREMAGRLDGELRQLPHERLRAETPEHVATDGLPSIRACIGNAQVTGQRAPRRRLDCAERNLARRSITGSTNRAPGSAEAFGKQGANVVVSGGRRPTSPGRRRTSSRSHLRAGLQPSLRRVSRYDDVVPSGTPRSRARDGRLLAQQRRHQQRTAPLLQAVHHRHRGGRPDEPHRRHERLARGPGGAGAAGEGRHLLHGGFGADGARQVGMALYGRTRRPRSATSRARSWDETRGTGVIVGNHEPRHRHHRSSPRSTGRRSELWKSKRWLFQLHVADPVEVVAPWLAARVLVHPHRRSASAWMTVLKGAAARPPALLLAPGLFPE